MRTGSRGRPTVASCVLALMVAVDLSGQIPSNLEAVALPAVVAYSARIANQSPAGTFATVVSSLRYESLIEVEARSMAEAQADVTVRGGNFENTGFRVGGVTIYNPQSGHYFADIPLPPAMLEEPSLLTGAENAAAGFNATAGSIAWGWREIQSRGEARLAMGNYKLRRGELYQGSVSPLGATGRNVAADFAVGHSQCDGSVEYGDSDLNRLGVRLQLCGTRSQTDLYGGYQAKFFGWPNLYTPFGSHETENLQSSLVVLSHRMELADGGFFQISGYLDRNKDDYAFNRFAPVGAVHPFQHTTWVRGASLEGRASSHNWSLAYNAQTMRDCLRSTSLTFGRFNTRTYEKLSLVPEARIVVHDSHLVVRLGGTFDDTNRDRSAVSPVIAAEWIRGAEGKEEQRVYAQFSGSTQVPTYTALNANPDAGLFRGNANLVRETSRNLEIGARGKNGGWQWQTALFYRRDDNLVDWTFRPGVTARYANAINLSIVGFEAVVSHKSACGDVVFGYTYLHKDPHSQGPSVGASFYALNFAKHRFNMALVGRTRGGFEVRLDNEMRIQEDNPLRGNGGNAAALSSLGLYYLPSRLPGVEFSLQIDNLWNSTFQEVPAVPAAKRQSALGVTWRW